MRLTGSFQTIVTQGVSGTTSSPASGRSTSTSAGATLTGLSPPRSLTVSLNHAPPGAGHACCPGLVRHRAAPIRSLPLPAARFARFGGRTLTCGFYDTSTLQEGEPETSFAVCLCWLLAAFTHLVTP